MQVTLLLLLLAQSNQQVHDWLQGAEIGDREQAMTFGSTGRYRAERKDASGQTFAYGTWQLKDSTLSVTVHSCKGPACKTFGTSFRAEVAVVGGRALTVDPTPADVPFARGSYYCHYQGCERRVGVRVLTHAASPAAIRAVTERLIEANIGRNTTVVWSAPPADAPLERSSVLFCPSGGELAHRGAQATVADLAALDWLGSLGPPTAASGDCLWDVQVTVADAVAVGRPRPAP
jgi:hypothetical protein